jgi:hypothetical protein
MRARTNTWLVWLLVEGGVLAGAVLMLWRAQ